MNNFLLEFIKKKWPGYISLLLLQLVLFLIFFLQGNDLKSLEYPMVVCIVIYLTYFAIDGAIAYSSHKKLEIVAEHVELTLENLPEAHSLIEEDYQKLLSGLKEISDRAGADRKKSEEDMIEFITIWTHQVKTPLTALQLAAQELEGPEKNLIIGRLFEIEQYSDMILQYLRMGSTSTDYEFESYSVKSMVSQAVKYFSRTFISKGISVKIDVDDSATIVTDEKWLVFVLKQIISNSLKYTEKGSITIAMPSPNAITITDTGIGISKEDLPRIFERGYTGYNGRKDKKATGIGLFLVKSILEKIGGTVIISSVPGEGTCVRIDIL